MRPKSLMLLSLLVLSFSTFAEAFTLSTSAPQLLSFPAHSQLRPTLARPKSLGNFGNGKKPQPLSLSMTAGWLRDQEGMAKDLNTRKAQNLMVLGGLTSEQAVEMLSQASLIKAEEGQELMLEGRDVTVPAEERKVFMVLRGSANVFKGGRLLGTARPGEFLGESRYLELEALEQLGKLQVDVLQDLFDIADTDESGTLDLQEVQEALNSKGLELTLQQTRQIIAGLDADSDGELSMDELRGATLPLGKKLVIQQMFRKMDKDASGAIEPTELRESLEEVFGVELDDSQCKAIMKLLGAKGTKLYLSDIMKIVSNLKDSRKLKEAFLTFDSDGSGKIQTTELEQLLSSVGVFLSKEQLELLIDSIDMDSDGEMDYKEFSAAVRRLEQDVQGKFGDALGLFEAVAFNTQKGSQVQVAAAEKISYFVWDVKDLSHLFAQDKDLGSAVRNLWAFRLAGKLKATTANIDSDPEAQDANTCELGDYGYGGNFLYGKYGDFGPLGKAVPGNAVRMAIWNFGREYRALRNAFSVGEFTEFVESISGADTWLRKVNRLRGEFKGLDEEGVYDKIRKEFDLLDQDGSGSLSLDELRQGLKDLGIEVTEREAQAMLKVADKDANQRVSFTEFEALLLATLKGGADFQAIFDVPRWIPGWMRGPFTSVVKLIADLDNKGEAMVSSKLRPPPESENISEETRQLREKLSMLLLDNDAVWEREENRRAQLMRSLELAKQQAPSPDQEELVEQLEQTMTPTVIFIPYLALCWLIDVLFVNRPIQRFWFLETVARMPYFSYTTMLTLYETLGWWRSSSDTRRIHFAEEWNEVQHLKIMEALGGGRLWIDRFLALHSALFYYIILNHIWLLSPSWAYNFSELIEFHAVDTYGEFVDKNKELLKSMPPPQEAVDYYNGQDMYLFDEFQTGRDPKSRRPKIDNLYDVFCNIRNDELEHVKTMFQCQTAVQQLMSPNVVAAEKERDNLREFRDSDIGYALEEDPEKIAEGARLQELVEIKKAEVRKLEERLRQVKK